MEAPRGHARSAVPALRIGERLALTGRTGVGKTYLGKWFILRNPQQWVVMDTKADPSFDEWRPRAGLLTMRAIGRLWRDGRKAVVIRPHPREMGGKNLDAYLEELHSSFDGFGTFIDEAYQFQIGGLPGKGLTGLISRGRVRKQTVIMGAQRPRLVAAFMFSEATYMAIMDLLTTTDRKTMNDKTGRDEVFVRLPKREWLWYDVDAQTLRRFPPVTIVPKS